MITNSMGLIAGVLALVSVQTNTSPWSHPSNAALKARLSRVGVETPAPKRTNPEVRPAAPIPAKPTPCRRTSKPSIVILRDTAVPAFVIPPGVWDLIRQEAERIGISPVTMLAIQWHETGGYRSPLWRHANNPGGIEFRYFDGIKCWRHNGGRWAAFETPSDGIRAHARVLGNQRYAAARECSDPCAQVGAIANGGYAEYSPSWTSKVRATVRKFLTRLNRLMDRKREATVD